MHYDLVVVGTGAGGGTLLHALATWRKEILVLARADFPRPRRACCGANGKAPYRARR
jgi:choline dehydrogenase-like flavoprotein